MLQRPGDTPAGLALRVRLHPDSVELDPVVNGLVATMPRETFVVEPGVQRLVPREVPDTPPWLRMHAHSRCDSFADFVAGGYPITYATVLHLERRDYGLSITCDVNRPVALRLDFSCKWKRHPPSKRRRMRSWKRAPYTAKRRYAPLSNYVGPLPIWALHPDHFRLERLGQARVVQRIAVYAQSGADIDELMDRHSREWVGRVSGALARPRRDMP